MRPSASLPQLVKDEAVAQATKLATQHGVPEPVDFRALIAGLNDAFVHWRYVYEHASLGTIHIQPTILVMHVLHEMGKARAGPSSTKP
jgi:hypothetical protein